MTSSRAEAYLASIFHGQRLDHVYEGTREARERWESVRVELEELAHRGGEEAQERYREMKPQVDALARALEDLGRSEEAREVRRRLDDLLRRGSEGPAPPPLPEAPPPPPREVPPAPGGGGTPGR